MTGGRSVLRIEGFKHSNLKTGAPNEREAHQPAAPTHARRHEHAPVRARYACKSAVSFSFSFLVTAPRMRACACVTASRLCVRTVLCSSAFLLVPSYPSTNSAVDRSTLFAGFAGTIDESDFFVPFIIGYGLRPSRCRPRG